jgi:hypothetical protein
MPGRSYVKTAACIHVFLICSWMHAQGPIAPIPDDQVRMHNNDHLSGQLTWADAGGLILKTQALSTLKLKWTDIRQVELNHSFVIRCNDCTFSGRSFNAAQIITTRSVPTSAGRNETWLDIQADPGQLSLPAKNLLSLEPPSACSHPNSFMCPGWHLDKLKLDINVLGATQKQQTYGAAFKTIRNWNAVSSGWPHQRSLLELAASYDDKRQNATAKANITQNYNGTFQQLFFLKSEDVYSAIIVDLYHNNSLGLYFQQAYGAGGGVTFGGWELDADLRFIGEHLYSPGPSVGLFGTRLSEQYDFDLSHIRKGLRLTEIGRVTPVFNRDRSWQAQGKLELVIPLSDTIGLTVTPDDNYVENAPKGFRQNYFKLTLGLLYTPAKKP